MKRYGMPTAAPGGTIANPQRARAIELTPKGWAAIGKLPPAGAVLPAGPDPRDYAVVAFCSGALDCSALATIDTGVVDVLAAPGTVASVAVPGQGLTFAEAERRAEAWVRSVPPGLRRSAFVVRVVGQWWTPDEER